MVERWSRRRGSDYQPKGLGVAFFATGPGLGLIMYILTTLEFLTHNFDFHLMKWLFGWHGWHVWLIRLIASQRQKSLLGKGKRLAKNTSKWPLKIPTQSTKKDTQGRHVQRQRMEGNCVLRVFNDFWLWSTICKCSRCYHSVAPAERSKI